MKEISIQAHAKINLTLDVTGKREDGYHLVKMVMQTLKLHDDVIVRIGTGGGITIESALPWLPKDRRNLAYQAAEAFIKKTQVDAGGVAITLKKRIPVAAGLAGGSADAAAVLLALNKLFGGPMNETQLKETGLLLGADVPYCLTGGTMLAEGIGEELTALAPLPPCKVVLCKPPFSVSTKDIYTRLDTSRMERHPDTAGVIAALRQEDINGVAHRMYNVMEEVCAGLHKEVNEIKHILLECGALGAVMSGSGPTVFGLFQQEDTAGQAYRLLKGRFQDTFLTGIYTPHTG